jgi:hypothetical protein
MTRLTDDQLNALKDRNPVAAIAGDWVALRRKGRAGQYVGPCPICSDDPQSKTAARFECDGDKWVCAVCQDGGDVIALMMRREGIDFAGAIERLGGRREEAPTPAIAERRGLQDHAAGLSINARPEYTGEILAAWQRGWRKGEARAQYEVFARERERTRLWGFWQAAIPIARAYGLHNYFSGRGLDLPPAGCKLGWHPAMPYFANGREREPPLIHTGAAMLAPILDANGRFSGLHITWLDPCGPKGKAQIIHPDTGEVLPAKKVRGSKAGGYIDLGGARDASRMIAGEGIETVAAVHTALKRAGRDLSRTLFRVGIDLGNLAGRATETLPHPTLKTAGGRPQRVPGPDFDRSAPAMPVPLGISEMILLGDGDSDPFLTSQAMERARRRAVADRPDRIVRIRFAAGGKDFNDMIKRPA